MLCVYARTGSQRMQINHYPPSRVSRTARWGWRLSSVFVKYSTDALDPSFNEYDADTDLDEDEAYDPWWVDDELEEDEADVDEDEDEDADDGGDDGGDELPELVPDVPDDVDADDTR